MKPLEQTAEAEYYMVDLYNLMHSLWTENHPPKVEYFKKRDAFVRAIHYKDKGLDIKDFLDELVVYESMNRK